jgi:hypothetical protein
VNLGDDLNMSSLLGSSPPASTSFHASNKTGVVLGISLLLHASTGILPLMSDKPRRSKQRYHLTVTGRR